MLLRISGEVTTPLTLVQGFGLALASALASSTGTQKIVPTQWPEASTRGSSVRPSDAEQERG